MHLYSRRPPELSDPEIAAATILASLAVHLACASQIKAEGTGPLPLLRGVERVVKSIDPDLATHIKDYGDGTGAIVVAVMRDDSPAAVRHIVQILAAHLEGQ